MLLVSNLKLKHKQVLFSSDKELQATGSLQHLLSQSWHPRLIKESHWEGQALFQPLYCITAETEERKSRTHLNDYSKYNPDDEMSQYTRVVA